MVSAMFWISGKLTHIFCLLILSHKVSDTQTSPHPFYHENNSWGGVCWRKGGGAGGGGGGVWSVFLHRGGVGSKVAFPY